MSETPEVLTPRPLTGPGFGPPSGDHPEHLCILLHGLGASGNDLIALAPLLAGSLPKARFTAPQPPGPCALAPLGLPWCSPRDPAAGALGRGRRAPPWVGRTWITPPGR